MPSRTDMTDMVANQMMKGPRAGRLSASPQEKQRFISRHEENIQWVLERLPRASCAVAAVTMKCLIKYGREPVERWCDALKHQNFNGQNDPAYHLWKFLLKHKGRNTLDIYRKSLCAAKNYMEGKTITQLRPYQEDVFQWDADWTVPDEFIEGYNRPDKDYEAILA